MGALPTLSQEKSIGQLLMEEGALTAQQLEEALVVQREKGGRLGEIFVDLKFVSPEDVLRAFSSQLGVAYVTKISTEEVPLDLIQNLSINFAKRNELIPFGRHGGKILVAVADPLNVEALDDLRLLYRHPIVSFISSSHEILNAINVAYNRQTTDNEGVIDSLGEEGMADIQDLEEVQDLLESDDEAPIIRLVNQLLFRAVKQNASDIHIEPFERDLVVRFRIDGVLYDIMHPPKKALNSIMSRIKIMSNMNIAEKRLPQDGRIRIKLAGKDIDIRVSTIPTTHGESVVMRILDKSKVLLTLDSVGFEGENLKRLRLLIHQSHGIVLVTGPTGSGKTTTLYACLSEIASPQLKIITVEDPVEYQIDGINQIQVNPKIDLTFATGLRAILRQDPDVVMVGEIRDRETAEIAVQASLTGHLVISTLHTNDSATSVTRLVDMGIEPFLVASSFTGVLAQRLIRTLCEDCREVYTPTAEESAEIGVHPQDLEGATIYRSTGCANCLNTGFVGRMAIHEILIVDDELRSLIMQGVDATILKRRAMEKGMKTIREQGAKLVLAGTTTIAEVLRVTQEDVARAEGS